MDVDNVVSVLANTLYFVKTRRVSVRKAFTEACMTHKCSGGDYTREELYQLARLFISKYYTLKYISEKGGRSKPTHRVLARLFLYLFYVERGIRPPSKLKKAVLRDLPGLGRGFESIEPYARYSFPEWMYYKFAELLTPIGAEELLSAMNKRSLWLRVNTLKVDVDKAVKALEESGVIVEVDRDVPYLLRVIESTRPLRTHKLFHSALLRLLLHPLPASRSMSRTRFSRRASRHSQVFQFVASSSLVLHCLIREISLLRDPLE